jgi:hypothetical protein
MPLPPNVPRRRRGVPGCMMVSTPVGVAAALGTQPAMPATEAQRRQHEQQRRRAQREQED